MPVQLDLFGMGTKASLLAKSSFSDFEMSVREFSEWGEPTQVTSLQWKDAKGNLHSTPVYTNEFWTAKQRQANSLHEVSYRACFKPQLPRFFIDRLTRPGDVVYDPFMGRGTTPLEAALLGRIPFGCDINPLSQKLLLPRLCPPSLRQVERRLMEIPLEWNAQTPEDLLVFYHPDTLKHLCALRAYFQERAANGTYDSVDGWLEMVCLNRLTGHSNGFFSVYTLPPNQAVSVKSQIRINQKRNQTPPFREVRKIILKKSRLLLSDATEEVLGTVSSVFPAARLLIGPAGNSPQIESHSVHLVVTSPPFLEVVDYATDNWLRGWFAGIDTQKVALTVSTKIDYWQEVMQQVFNELNRVLRPGGHVAFEVGEVRKGSIRMEDLVLPLGSLAGLHLRMVMINAQEFTKTANCWGVDNQLKGTNTNRIVVFQKE